jgi:hypothetical protein
MEATVLSDFLQSIVQKHRRDRYAGYLTTEKGKKKWLAALDHDFERAIDPRKVVKTLSEEEWSSAAVFFSSAGDFQVAYESTRKAYDNAPWEGGWLIVGSTGKFGVYRPEGGADGELFVKL